ncbi:hypothetical protein LguiA_021679 [Lonicera macranthoides]
MVLLMLLKANLGVGLAFRDKLNNNSTNIWSSLCTSKNIRKAKYRSSSYLKIDESKQYVAKVKGDRLVPVEMGKMDCILEYKDYRSGSTFFFPIQKPPKWTENQLHMNCFHKRRNKAHRIIL